MRRLVWYVYHVCTMSGRNLFSHDTTLHPKRTRHTYAIQQAALITASVTIGALCVLLGRQDSLLAVETRLWRWDKMGRNGTK